MIVFGGDFINNTMKYGDVTFPIPDYKKIREESKRMNHTILPGDFNTHYPSHSGLDYAARDIAQYLRCRHGRCIYDDNDLQ